MARDMIAKVDASAAIFKEIFNWVSTFFVMVVLVYIPFYLLAVVFPGISPNEMGQVYSTAGFFFLYICIVLISFCGMVLLLSLKSKWHQALYEFLIVAAPYIKILILVCVFWALSTTFLSMKVI